MGKKCYENNKSHLEIKRQLKELIINITGNKPEKIKQEKRKKKDNRREMRRYRKRRQLRKSSKKQNWLKNQMIVARPRGKRMKRQLKFKQCTVVKRIDRNWRRKMRIIRKYVQNNVRRKKERKKGKIEKHKVNVYNILIL